MITTRIPGRPRIKLRSTKGMTWTGPMIEETTGKEISNEVKKRKLLAGAFYLPT